MIALLILLLHWMRAWWLVLILFFVLCAVVYAAPFLFWVARFLGWPWQRPARSRYWWRGD